MSIPQWVQDAIFYQIFPDRFSNGDTTNDPVNVQKWGSQPTNWGFQGGDLRGIIHHLDYLIDLGINAIYLNPIFMASSNHRYNTSDYFKIDPKLGDLADFQELIQEAHSNQIRIILDGVFNHCGRGFFAFNDILENQAHSPYRDWFYIKQFPVRAYPDGDASDYLAWWKFNSLPKLNTQNEAVRNYLFEVAKYWIDQGADGWRLDVPNEINDDEFWFEFRHQVGSVNPEAYLVGEIWQPEPRWVGDHHFDGLMNYPVMDAIIAFLNETLPLPEFAAAVDHLLSIYPRDNSYAMYVPLGSHDTARLLTRLDHHTNKVKLAFLFQFAYPGAPAIYYGDEIGLDGGKDPECRKAFPWDRSVWCVEIYEWVKKLARLRNRFSAFRQGDFRRICLADLNKCYAFARTTMEEQFLIILNASSTSQSINIQVDSMNWEDGRIVQDVLNEQKYVIANGSILLSIPAWSGGWIFS